MTVCSMCRNQFTPADETELSYIAEGKPICETCSGHLDTILESDDQKEIRNSINYVYTCQKQSSDPAITSALNDFLENNASIIEELEEKAIQKKHSEPVQFSGQTDYFHEKSSQSESGMFGNVAGSIKSLTKFFCWIGIIISVICACLLFAANNPYQSTILPGLLCLVLGPFFSWSGSLFLYAFADLLDETKKNNQLLTELVKHSKPHNNSKKK